MSCDICGGSIETDREWVRARGEDFCSVCASDEIENLRDRVDELEESIRWRKWPEEKPEKSGRYLKLLRDRCEELTRFNLDEYCKVTQKWWGGDPIYWRPIGNLPEGGE